MQRQTARLTIIISIFLIIVGGIVQAQDDLSYGDRMVGEITASNAQVIYPFTGTAGDWVTIQVISLSANMSPTIALTAPSGEQLVFSTEMRLGYSLMESGQHVIQVGSADNVTGSFVILLDGISADSMTTLTDATTSATLTSDTPQLFAIVASPDQPITLNIDVDGEFSLEIYSPSGEYLGLINNTVLPDNTLSLPTADGAYYAMFDVNEALDVTLTISEVIAMSARDTGSTASDIDTTVCTVTAEGGASINIRNGNGTDFNAFSVLTADINWVVTGITNNNWYQIDVSGATGYVFANVVVVNGLCDGLPVVVGPPLPATTVPPTAEPQQPPPAPPPQTTEDP